MSNKYDFSAVEDSQLESMIANLGQSASPFKDALLAEQESRRLTPSCLKTSTSPTPDEVKAANALYFDSKKATQGIDALQTV